jgi:hypothetical protein
LFALALAGGLFGWGGLLAAAESLPVTAAETLTGAKVSFPTALAGKPAVCVFGFSKEAGDRTIPSQTSKRRRGSFAG